jgi:glycosyltransferase involved in cell wall biosynthesis
MKLGLVIATYRRADILEKVLRHLLAQPRVPDEIVISAVDATDIPNIANGACNIQKVFGPAGSCSQRNRGISHLLGLVDVIAFIDDDFIVGDDYFLNMERMFAQDRAVLGFNGAIIADGADSAGFTFEEGLRFVEDYSKHKQKPVVIREVRGPDARGCNGNIAFRAAEIGALRFDEHLPLYGWQEDLDFCGALCRAGRTITSNLVWGVHLGTKRGKGSELRLGYSQMVNPIYIVRKGNMSLGYAFRLAANNFLANLFKSIHPESYIDRRGRLRGNLIGIFHLVTGRLTPEYILKMY